MANIEFSRPVPFGAIITLRIVNTFDALRSTIVGTYKANKTKKALNRLSNAQLQDIGLERAQISAVSAAVAQA
ncbi:MAG: DUF1127 domain-containing protein [Rhodobacteraceae bacterium]|nr:DUF1127 domain-containing protein [Paracoccaceae bacterium]